MSKKILVALFTAIFTLTLSPMFAKSANTATNNSRTIQWHTNYKMAAQLAKKEHKPLLLFFTGSDWCGWCKKMDHEIFESPEFVSEAGKQFVFVELDFPMGQQPDKDLMQQNNQLKQKFGVSGFPTVIILDSDGNFLAETGYRPGGGRDYAEYLHQLVN